MTRLKVGFIGAGRIADLHARAYRGNPHATIGAVADSTPGRARARADEWGASQAYEDYRALLADKSIDAVEVLLPHHLHSQVGIEALAAGKSVSMQKPPGVTLAEADALFAAAQSSGRVFRVFDNFLHWAPFLRAKALIDNDEIGEPVLFKIGAIYGRGVGGWDIPPEASAWRSDPANSGGPPSIIDHGAHMAATMLYFMGPAAVVHAFNETGNESSGVAVNSPLTITCRFQRGRRLGVWTKAQTTDVEVPTDYYPGDEFVEVVGSKGVIWVNRCSGKMLDTSPVTLFSGGRLRRFDDMETDWGESFRVGGEQFIAALRDGSQPDMSPEFAREVYLFQLAAIESAESGREVSTVEIDSD